MLFKWYHAFQTIQSYFNRNWCAVQQGLVPHWKPLKLQLYTIKIDVLTVKRKMKMHLQLIMAIYDRNKISIETSTSAWQCRQCDGSVHMHTWMPNTRSSSMKCKNITSKHLKNLMHISYIDSHVPEPCQHALHRILLYFIACENGAQNPWSKYIKRKAMLFSVTQEFCIKWWKFHWVFPFLTSIYAHLCN